MCVAARARVDAGTRGPRGLLLRVTAAWRDDGWSASFTRGAPSARPPGAPPVRSVLSCRSQVHAGTAGYLALEEVVSAATVGIGYAWLLHASSNVESAIGSSKQVRAAAAAAEEQQRSSRGAAGEQQGGNLGDPTLGARAATVDMSGVPGEGGQGKGGKIRGSGGHEARAGSGRGGSAGFPWPPVGCCARCCARCCNHSYPTLCMSGASALGAQGAVRLRWGARGRCATSMTARVLGLVRTRLCVRLRFPLPVLTCLPEISRPRSHLEVR